MRVLLFLSTCMMAYAQNAERSIIQLAQDLGATELVKFVRLAGLEGALNGKGPFTVFAPTNAAFNALPDAVKDQLTKDKSLLAKVLSFHVANGAAYSSQLTNDMLVDSLDAGLKIRVNIYMKDGANVVTVDGSKVVMVDQNATNGVIHVIDHVMYPLPSATIPTTLAMMPQFGTLVYAVAQGQLVGPLEGSGPFTIFAPNNEAFNKLPPGTLSGLLQNQTALVGVLKYHVVQATAYSAGLSSGNVQTLEGRNVAITVNAEGVKVNDAKVVMADTPAANGVIHEIDTVLLPPSFYQEMFHYDPNIEG